ncbi:hypothetical protein DNTS_003526 [Danionella cerebrum]|uniref:THUMP domain-containing protein n=1 Tax=Danionella cerebrum TaxID=2873325 RepID=A0A553P5J9_9TELE|nr:hypothetical protein DNTS_003526 [Danionella translucida]
MQAATKHHKKKKKKLFSIQCEASILLLLVMMEDIANTVTIGATVPTGFENSAVEEVQEKLGTTARVSKNRGKIYFDITTDELRKVHLLKSLDNLFVVIKTYEDYQFKASMEEVNSDWKELAAELPWTNALEVWKLNNSIKKKKSHRNKNKSPKPDQKYDESIGCNETVTSELLPGSEEPEVKDNQTDVEQKSEEEKSSEIQDPAAAVAPLKFRVTCSRAGDNHCFTSNDAAREFGGAVQELFQWKADMTKFDVEVLLDIHDSEVVIAIALTVESLHRRNITHFGPTTLRSTLAYGMLRLCKPQISDVIVDPMCGSGAIPLEGAMEWAMSFFLAGDNNGVAVSRSVSNVKHILKKTHVEGSASGLAMDVVQWDLCNLPMRSSSVDIIVTDMPFGKRMGSKKKNWELYPQCLLEMARVCRPGTGKAVLLTQDKKSFTKALLQMRGHWKKLPTVWVNVGGLNAGVFLLKRTAEVYGSTSKNAVDPQTANDFHKEGKEAGPQEA